MSMMESEPELITFKDVDFLDPHILNRRPYRRRRSPLLCTLSDTQITTVDIQRLLEAGMNVVRIKMPYSTMIDKQKLLGKVDKATMACCEKFGVTEWPVTTCLSIKTSLVRTGLIETDKSYIVFKESDEVTMTCNLSQYNKCNEHVIFADNTHIAVDVKVGMEIIIDQEEIILICVGIVDDQSIKCSVTKGGKLRNLCNVSVREIKHTRPLVTAKDLQIVKFALEYQVDMVIINCVRHVDTIKKIKKYMRNFGREVKKPILFSGISTQQCLENIDEIIKETDGILLSREYLPYELKASMKYRMAQIQKYISGKCQKAGKPLYISCVGEALLKGAIEGSEVSDITNALLEGVSGFVLGEFHDAEMAVSAIRTINDICCSVEPFTHSKADFFRMIDEIKMPSNAAVSCIMSSAIIANQSNARVIVIPTVTGRTVTGLLSMKSSCIVMTVSTSLRITRLLQSYRSVVALRYTGPQYKKWNETIEARVNFAIEFAVKRGWLVYGDTYVSLQRATEFSSFCDKVTVWNVMISKKTRVECEY